VNDTYEYHNKQISKLIHKFYMHTGMHYHRQKYYIHDTDN